MVVESGSNTKFSYPNDWSGSLQVLLLNVFWKFSKDSLWEGLNHIISTRSTTDNWSELLLSFLEKVSTRGRWRGALSGDPHQTLGGQLFTAPILCFYGVHSHQAAALWRTGYLRHLPPHCQACPGGHGYTDKGREAPCWPEEVDAYSWPVTFMELRLTSWKLVYKFQT